MLEYKATMEQHGSKEVCMNEVSQDGYAIQLIDNPDKDVQLAAVQQNGDIIRFISDPDEDVLLAVNTK